MTDPDDADWRTNEAIATEAITCADLASEAARRARQTAEALAF